MNLTPNLVSLFAGVTLVLHLVVLLVTNHATVFPMGMSPATKCGDKRESTRGSTIFGGASAFDFGLAYGLAGMFLPLPGWLAAICIGYANMRFFASLLQTVNFMYQSAKSVGEGNVTLKSHWKGCGYTTAASPLWIIFWIQKIPGMGWVVIIRDIITTVDFVFSLPAMLVFNVWTLATRRRWTIPQIGPVDSPHAH